MWVPETSPKVNEAWAALGAALGYRAYLIASDFRESDGFRQLASRLGMPSVSPNVDDWLVGAFDGARVLVCSYRQEKKLLDGANSSDGVSRFTAVLVELDPPFFMGARVAREDAWARAFGGGDLELGIPEVDRALRLASFDADALRALLSPTGPDDHAFLERLGGLASGGLYFTDSFVAYRLPNAAHDAAMIHACVQNAAWVRRELLARRSRVQQRPHEAALSAAWAAYAEASSLRFDASRFSLSGVEDGVAIEIALAPTAGPPMTSVSARWHQPIGVQLRLTKFDPRSGGDPELETGAHRAIVQFFTDMITQDIRVGDRKFDDAFQVQGFPPDQVKSALASPAFREAMVQIAAVSSEVAMTDQGVTWFMTGLANAADLERHVRMAVHTAKSLYPVMVGGAAYR